MFVHHAHGAQLALAACVERLRVRLLLCALVLAWAGPCHAESRGQRPSSGAGVAARLLRVCRLLPALRLSRAVLAAHRPRRPAPAVMMRLRALWTRLRAPLVRLRARSLRLRALLMRLLALWIRLRARRLHLSVLWVHLWVRETWVVV